MPRTLSCSALCLSLLLHGAVPRHTEAAAAECSLCRDVDTFEESLEIHVIPHTSSPRLFLAHVDFQVEADLTPEFRNDQFDLFPKSIGKLLNAHRSLVAFEAVLTQGRWKEEEWGAPLRELRPPGAVLVAATNSSEEAEVERSWKFLTGALSGSLCASFEGLDPSHRHTASWVRPLNVPLSMAGQQLRFGTLPYEPVCTENLTPWLKLLPCGRWRGLAALLQPLAVAESPLVSLSLAAVVHEARVVLRASLDVVLPLDAGRPGISAWFGADQAFTPCPAARSSLVRLMRPPGDDVEADGVVEEVTLESFAAADADFAGRWTEASATSQEAPWLRSHATGSDGIVARGSGGSVAVMRDVLSYEGKSERTNARYLLRFTNTRGQRRVRFMDQLPFFLRPLWHTFQVTVKDGEGNVQELHGVEAMKRLGLTFVPSDGQRVPTEVFLTVDVPAGGTVSVILDVLKIFIKLREFSYACEKGFDVGSAAWLELDSADAEVSTADFAASLASVRGTGGAKAEDAPRLRFTSGLLILVPMPDFSMPFNVIALSATAMTFFFGSLFRITSAGRLPHWVLKSDVVKRGVSFYLKKGFQAAVLLTLVALTQVEHKQVGQLREFLPEELHSFVGFLEFIKDKIDDFNDVDH